MQIQEPAGIKFEERGLSDQRPVTSHHRIFQEDTDVRMHYHSSMEINLCREVRGIVNIEGKAVSLKGLTAIIIQPEVLHSYRIAGSGGQMEVLHIGLDSFSSILNVPVMKRNLKEMLPSAVMLDNSESDIMTMVSELAETSHLHQYRQPAGFLSLLDFLTSRFNGRSPEMVRDPFLHKIISYTEKNYRFPLSIEMAAEQVHLSRYHFCRKFREKTGQTFNEYLNNLRLEHSLAFLDRGRSVGEAAELSGYADVSYFIKRFRMMYGITPGAYLTHLSDQGGAGF